MHGEGEGSTSNKKTRPTTTSYRRLWRQ